MPDSEWSAKYIRDGFAVIGTTPLLERAAIRTLVLALDEDYADATGQMVQAETAERQAVAEYVETEMARITATLTDPTAVAAIRDMLMREAYTQPGVLAAVQATATARMMLAVQDRRLRLLEVLKDIVVAHHDAG